MELEEHCSLWGHFSGESDKKPWFTHLVSGPSSPCYQQEPPLGLGFYRSLRVRLQTVMQARKWLFAWSVLLSVCACTHLLGEALISGEHQVLLSHFGHWAKILMLSVLGSGPFFPQFLVMNPCIIALKDKSLFREGKLKHRVQITFFPPFSIQIPLKNLPF